MVDEEKVSFDNFLDSVIIIDKENKIRELNSATLNLLGYKKEELILSPLGTVCKDLSVDGLRSKIPLKEQELIYLNKEGKEIPVSINITKRISYPDDLIFIARDIKKDKQLIAELLQSQKELKKSYQELQESHEEVIRSEKLAFTGRIAANIAHEIRNPLTNVSISLGQLKKRLKLDDQKKEHMEIIQRNVQRINYLISELLNSARPPKLNFQVYDIHKLLKEVLESNKATIRLQKIKTIKRFTSNPSPENLR